MKPASATPLIWLAYDTDTVSAVTRTATGLLYGLEGIPKRWLDVLGRRDYLETVAMDFAECFKDQQNR